MYHGEVVPGFPGTRTAASRRSPSCAAASSTTPTPSARPPASAGDTQWLTAGRGIVHSEMFPLVNPDVKPQLKTDLEIANVMQVPA